ncbi:MAG: hypothetical protein ACOCV9_03270 [Marinilabiliaceae bacterium]
MPEDGIYFFEAFVTIDTRSNPPGNFYLDYLVDGFSAASHRQYSFHDGHTTVRFNTSLRLEKGRKVSLKANPTTNPTTTMGANASGTVRMTGFKVE